MSSVYAIFALYKNDNTPMAFETEIKEYESLRKKYQTMVVKKMDEEEYLKYNEILFSTHSCAIEGNSFGRRYARTEREGLGDDSCRKNLVRGF